MLVLWVGVVLALVGSACGQANDVTEPQKFQEESSYQPCECPQALPGVTCSCVVYYLCDESGVIKTLGTFLLDDRIGGDGETLLKCPGVQVCCQDPNSTISNPVVQTTPPFVPPAPIDTPRPTPPPPPVPVPPPTDNQGCGMRRKTFDVLDIWTRLDSDDSDTAFAEFPWMLALLKSDETGINVFICGASLIRPQVALTAAHCVHKWKPSQLVVRGGEWNTTSVNEPLVHQDREVSDIILHPDFFRGNLINDFAILLLKESFNAADNIDVVCLPEVGMEFDNQRCIATGWGRDSFGKEGTMQTTLRKVELPMLDIPSCQAKLRTTRLGIYFKVHESFICAGGELGKDTCKGDGGGPLMCPSLENKDRYIQAGIVSWGIGCKDTQIPAVYAKVSYARNWIDSQLTLVGLY